MCPLFCLSISIRQSFWGPLLASFEHFINVFLHINNISLSHSLAYPREAVNRSLAVWPDCTIYCTLANFKSLWQQLFCPNRPHFSAIFIKMSKSYIFPVESFLGNFYSHWATCLLVTLFGSLGTYLTSHLQVHFRASSFYHIYYSEHRLGPMREILVFTILLSFTCARTCLDR